MNIKPLGDRLLVQPVKTSDKIGRIIIPERAKEKPSEAVVAVIGTGKIGKDGNRIPFPVEVDDTIIVSKYGGSEITVDGRELRMINTDDILAVLK
jgi:chaperonin GroES